MRLLMVKALILVLATAGARKTECRPAGYGTMRARWFKGLFMTRPVPRGFLVPLIWLALFRL